MIKKIFIVGLIIFVLLQLIPTKKNISATANTNNIATKFITPQPVQDILKKACNDCHSNNTNYPWYNKIQPVAMWLHNHIEEGKGEINFDEFATYSPRRMFKKTNEIIKQVKEEKEMPLGSYTIIHKDAILTTNEIETIATWALSIQDSLKKVYPMDSLIRKK